MSKDSDVHTQTHIYVDREKDKDKDRDAERKYLRNDRTDEEQEQRFTDHMAYTVECFGRRHLEELVHQKKEKENKDMFPCHGRKWPSVS